MPFNATRSWETPSTYENAYRLAEIERGVERSDGAVRSALAFVARAAAGATPQVSESLKVAAQLATDGDAAIADAHAEVRAAREAHDRDQAEYETRLAAASERAAAAWQLADAAIERCP
jgi:hypothetical protein